jgi:hypothetical protein
MNDQALLYNSRLMKIYLEYISKYHPDVSIDSILDEAGITWYEVEDPAHWFNQEQIDRFHETLVKKTGNANIARDSGRYMSTSASAGAVKQYALGLMNLTAIYLLMGKMYPFMSRGAKIKVKKLGSAIIEWGYSRRRRNFMKTNWPILNTLPVFTGAMTAAAISSVGSGCP